MRSFAYKLEKHQKQQLTLNILLMILTLFTLICCVIAWFASSTFAELKNLEMSVQRSEVNLLSQITKIEFPCATNIGNCTEQEFTEQCAVEKVYYLTGTDPLHTEVVCSGAGMLAYVCPTSSGQYFTTMMSELKSTIKKNDPTTWTFSEVQKALDQLNDRRVGDIATFNGQACTAIRVIYWTAYTDGAKVDLEQSGYWYSDYVDADSGKSEYFAQLTFTI